jgi:uncharacterized protein (UPF0333 family)
MQQVLNSQERNQAFLKFLLFFLVTIVLIVTAIFFNYRLPFSENKMLQSEVEVQRIQDVNQQKFVGRMQEAILLLDSMDKKNVNFDQINLLVNSKLQELAVLQQKDNTIYGKMDKMITDKLYDLQQAKKSLQEANGSINKMSTAQTELEKCQQDNIQLHTQLDGFRKATGIQ